MHWLDGAVIGAYILLVLALGVWAGRRERDADDYFLGGRSMPWVAVAISLYATSASALTFIGVPGAAYGGDFSYLQMAVGDILGRSFIAYFLLSAYFKSRVTTVYQLLGQRFGPQSQTLGTVFFLVTRVLASGVRLAGCGIAFSVIFGLPLNLTLFLVSLIAIIYTTAGGIKAVIWTDTLQFALFVGGAALVLGVILGRLPDGLDTFLEVGRAHGKFQIFHFEGSWNTPSHFVAGTIFGMFLTFAVLGTDQDLVQRMLTTRTAAESQRAMMLTAVLNIPMTWLFLSVGAALFAYYRSDPAAGEAMTAAIGTRADYVFPYFMKTALAPGLRGLLMAGLLAASMSSLDSALNALSSTAYIDLYKRYVRPEADGAEAVRVSRLFAGLFGALLLGVAVWCGRTDGILWLGLRVLGYTYGGVLGVFMLAVLTKTRGSDHGNALAMLTSVLLVVLLTSKYPWGFGVLAWPFAVTVASLWTFAVAALFRTPKAASRA